MPIGIKDIIDVAGMPTRAGAAAFAHTRPTVDAPLVARLRDAGAVILGKTHATQFAYRDPAPTRNPWSLEHTPGGSSSGSAAAVAARMVPAAIGTQTVGSILRPAAYCGVVGCKGSFGAVPLEGVVPLSRALDHAGPIVRSVADAALLEGVLTGRAIEIEPIDAPRIGLVRASVDLAEPGLRRHLDALAGRFDDAGARVVDDRAAGRLRRPCRTRAGCCSKPGRPRRTRRGSRPMPPTTRRPSATSCSPGRRGPRPRSSPRNEFARPRARPGRGSRPRVDALLTPVAVSSAPTLADGTGDGSLCAPWSTLGVPAIALPSGLDDDGLPFAVQLVGTVDDLGPLLGVAAWCERVIGFEARPAI